MSGEETPAQRNRRLFPGMAEFVDELRSVFGPDVKVREVHNDKGDKVGKTLEESGEMQGYWTSDQWLHMGTKLPTAQECIERAREDQRRAEQLRKGKGGKK